MVNLQISVSDEVYNSIIKLRSNKAIEQLISEFLDAEVNKSNLLLEDLLIEGYIASNKESKDISDD
ncbi:MAG: hypothetical protein NT007_05185 [Candidatus Kapabacteria bacterium]|nr:hypothetical protein [Candidatus Kapabacteria bacterium]